MPRLIYNLRVAVYNGRVDSEITVGQLSIVDGGWQEAPDNIAIVEEGARGTLFLLVDVGGDADGRDALARELIETARREYANSRGSITFGLTQAMREANNFFYNFNYNTLPESRRVAGITAVVLRENELFIAQGGPGLTCHVHGAELERYPNNSPWFDPGDEVGEFTTQGTVPLGMRRDYTPDLYHLKLSPGDTLLLATRALAHLLTNEELLDSLTRRHPDEIMDSLEDVAGAADLSAIAIHLSGASPVPDVDPVPPAVDTPVVPLLPTTPLAFTTPAPAGNGQMETDVSKPVLEADQLPPMPEITPEELERQREEEQQRLALEQEQAEQRAVFARARADEERERRRIQAEKARARRQRVWGSVLAGVAGTLGALAGLFSKIDWTGIGAAADRAISAVLRGLVYLVIFAVRAFLPGAPDEGRTTATPRVSNVQKTAWRVAAIAFPLLLLLAGGWAWFGYRQDTQRVLAAQVSQLIDQANSALKTGDSLSKTDKNAARASYVKAMDLTQQAQKLAPTNATARSVYFQAQDGLDGVNGISVLYLSKFATFADAKSNPTRIVARMPDVFIFDRGTQRIYRYLVNEAGSTAAPVGTDGVILKSGDKIGERTVGELMDILWIDAGRLVALDRSGLFLQYDPAKSAWTARPATDGSQWTRINLATSYVGYLYLMDPARNQIWKYVASAEGVWSSAVTFFAPGVNVDLTNVVDMAIDGDVWLMRADGSIWRFTAGKLTQFTPHELEVPIARPTSIFTTKETAWLYVADAGNQRILQFDKVTGSFVRQFKPRGEMRDASFNALKAVTAEEASKKFFIISGNQAYLATMPQ